MVHGSQGKIKNPMKNSEYAREKPLIRPRKTTNVEAVRKTENMPMKTRKQTPQIRLRKTMNTPAKTQKKQQ